MNQVNGVWIQMVPGVRRKTIAVGDKLMQMIVGSHDELCARAQQWLGTALVGNAGATLAKSLRSPRQASPSTREQYSRSSSQSRRSAVSCTSWSTRSTRSCAVRGSGVVSSAASSREACR